MRYKGAVNGRGCHGGTPPPPTPDQVIFGSTNQFSSSGFNRSQKSDVQLELGSFDMSLQRCRQFQGHLVSKWCMQLFRQFARRPQMQGILHVPPPLHMHCEPHRRCSRCCSESKVYHHAIRDNHPGKRCLTLGPLVAREERCRYPQQHTLWQSTCPCGRVHVLAARVVGTASAVAGPQRKCATSTSAHCACLHKRRG